jgi:hypothetical protein
MPMPGKLLATAVLAASAASFAAPAPAAPIAAPSALQGATAPLTEWVQGWGWGPDPYYGYYAPGYVYGGWGWNPGGAAPAPGYAAGYQAGAADVARCMERFRSYDPASRTYLGRDRRRHPCP